MKTEMEFLFYPLSPHGREGQSEGKVISLPLSLISLEFMRLPEKGRALDRLERQIYRDYRGLQGGEGPHFTIWRSTRPAFDVAEGKWERKPCKAEKEWTA